ncbi:EamA family transporter [Vulcanisaeta sp. EB80]|uniref:EamA family transporter n=1 Tax=Vulcanisaeta sp. EB80 TaxID=1650660 RepID=UPI0009BF29C0|nr:EamA family transporter [Vulcanisaeta sp. EB80]PLC64002.1 EamA family transporter [Vulcanisaeta sp. EB80]
MSYYILGIILSLAASVAWAVSPILYRIGATDSALDDLVSNSLGAFVLSIPLAILKPPLNGFAWVYGSLFAVLGPVFGTYVFLISLRYADVGIANVISYSYVVLLPLLLLIVSPSYLVYIGPAALIVLGLYLLMGSGRGKLYGYVMAILSAVLYAFSFLALYKVYEYTNPWGIILIRGIILMAGALIVKAVVEGIRVKLSGRVFLAGLISYGIGGPLYVLSVDYAGIAVPTLITALSPVITEVLAIIKLRERLNLRAIMGFIVVIAGIIIASIIGM